MKISLDIPRDRARPPRWQAALIGAALVLFLAVLQHQDGEGPAATASTAAESAAASPG